MLETLPQIWPSFNRFLRVEVRPGLLSADAGGATGDDGTERQNRLVGRAAARSAKLVLNPSSAVESAAYSPIVISAALGGLP